MEGESLMKTIRRYLGLASCLGLVLVTAQLPAGAVTSSANLVDLIQTSQSIITGSVTLVTDGIDQRGIPYTEVTVTIDETFKGRLSGEYTFRQFGLTARRATGDGRIMMPAPPEFPTFSAGEQVMLFLAPRASRTGLQTTVGLQVGKFNLSAGRAENGLGNVGVFEPISIDSSVETEADKRVLATAQGAVNPDSLQSLVRRAVEGNWIASCKMWVTADGQACGKVRPKPWKPGTPETPDTTPETTPVVTPDLD